MKKLIKEYRDEINNLLIPTMQKQLRFERPPTINFIEDEENAKDMFGRTAHYDPNTSEITVFISGRHPKDIMRSVAHEVVHHAQNCRGEFNNTLNLGEEGYAQSNNHLRKMEKEAYLLGNILFRDWEDNLKKQRNTNTMINEKALRAKIRSLIAEEMEEGFSEPEMQNESHYQGDDCTPGSKGWEEHERMLRVRNSLPNVGSNQHGSSLAEAINKAEKETMPLREWRNIELNSLLMSKFGIIASPEILGEKKSKGPKPDYLDLDKDGDKSEPMKQAVKQSKEKGSVKDDKPKSKKGKVPPQLQKYVKSKKESSTEKVEERKMTKSEKEKEEELGKEMGKAKVKSKMQKEYGKEKGEKIYYATKRKMAMDGK
jgi:hypothetical protein